MPANYRPRVADLVAIARDAGRHDASRRTINYWVGKRLVRRPSRVGGVYRYPVVSVGQGDVLARLNRRLIRPSLIKFALFIETNTLARKEAVTIASDELVVLRAGW